MKVALIACQAYVVLFIALHDWIPLGRLNNLEGIRAADGRSRLFVVTAASTAPFLAGLVGSIQHAASVFPAWLEWCLWLSYLAAAYGVLRTWWIPYLFASNPGRRARNEVRFAGTHSFLPERNGIRPDTLHVSFHAVLFTTIALLALAGR